MCCVCNTLLHCTTTRYGECECISSFSSAPLNLAEKMTSTRKSKKGFQKLENHELSEFTALSNGRLAESGSENDLLDLTAVEDGEPRGRWNSCCCWASCLYFGVLTCLFVLLGVYCGYLTFNLWQMNTSIIESRKSMDKKLAGMEKEMSTYKTEFEQRCSSMEQEILSLKDAINKTDTTLKQIHGNLGDSLSKVNIAVSDLGIRLELLESKPQEVLINQVDSINRDMGIMNNSMRKLNNSLLDIKEVKTKITELASINEGYDNELSLIKRSIADVRKDNTEMRETVDAAAGETSNIKSKLDTLDSSISSSKDVMKQTTDLISAQVASLQQSVSGLNKSFHEEVDLLWSNVTMVNASVDMLATNFANIQEKLVMLQNQNPDSSLSVDNTPTAPPRILSTPANLEETPTIAEELTTVPSEEPTTSSTEATPPVESTESTGATEDLMPGGNDAVTQTTASISEEYQTLENMTEIQIERTISDVEKDINTTQDAVNLLQVAADTFSDLDTDNSGTLDAFEFEEEIPKWKIFHLLDSNGDDDLTLEELLKNIDHLRLKINELKRERKTLLGIEEDLLAEEELPTQYDHDMFDSDLQQTLFKLYKFITKPQY